MVEVVRVDMEDRKIDFDLVGVIGESLDVKPGRRRKKDRKGKPRKRTGKRSRSR